MRPVLRHEPGGAAVELALLSALVMVPALFYLLLFFDISLAKIKLQEAARFAAWEFAVLEMSDWMNTDHDGRFNNTLMPGIKSRVQQYYGDDLNSLTPRFATSQVNPLLTMSVQMQDTDFKIESREARIFDMAGVTVAQDVIDQIFGWMKFNPKGLVYADVGATLKARFLPLNSMSSFVPIPLLTSDTLALMPARVVLLADTWDIKEGPNITEDASENTKFGAQVGRSAYLGFLDTNSSVGSALDKIGDVAAYVNVDLPTRTRRVMSFNYRDRSDDTGKTPALDVDNRPSKNNAPGKRFHTASLRLQSPKSTGEYYKTFVERLEKYYMGCPAEQTAEGDCTY